jgi:hypothetical protein
MQMSLGVIKGSFCNKHCFISDLPALSWAWNGAFEFFKHSEKYSCYLYHKYAVPFKMLESIVKIILEE